MSTVQTTDRSIVTAQNDALPALGDGVAGSLIKSAPQVGFVLFILLNAVLFIRPLELFPQLSALPLYEMLFAACMVVLIVPLIKRFSPSSLANEPITVSIFGVLATVVLSYAARRNFAAASQSGQIVAKLVIYYLFLVAAVNTPRRLQTFMLCLAIFGCVQISLGVLQNHGIIDLVALQPDREMAIARSAADAVERYRLCGAGIFHDPNDLSVLAAMTAGLCLYQVRLSLSRRGAARWAGFIAWAGATAICGYGTWLTRSRGGFIAMAAGLAILFFVQFGWKKSIPIALVAFPLLLKMFAGRQTDMRMITRTTSQMRLGYWAEGLKLLAESPLLGIGQGNFGRVVGNVAHNSFIHCFTELGFVGGTLFLGAFVMSLWWVYRLPLDDTPQNDDLRRMRPYLLAALGAWVVGMLSLSRSYVPPTYVIPGLATVYLGVAIPKMQWRRPRISGMLAVQLLALGTAFLAGVFVFVKVFHKG